MVEESCVEALANSVSLCMWLETLTVISLVINLLVKNVSKLFLHVFGTEKCIDCHQTLPLCEGVGQCQTICTIGTIDYYY